MNKCLKILSLVYIIYTLISCNSDPLLDIESAPQSIVVDGWIEEGSGPNVLLSWNTPYFTKLDSESIRNLVIRAAKVTISDSVTTEILTLKNNKKNFPPYVFQGFNIVGEAGKTYYLTVEYRNYVLQAQTTIPASIPIDSAWFKLNGKADSTGSVFVKFNDPPQEKNYYRFYSQCINNQHKFYPVFFSTYDDKHFKQSEVTLELNKGVEAYIEYEFDINYMLGDSIVMKMTTIDQNTFNYWDRYQIEVTNIGNPFATGISTLPSNISSPGLGVWAGYGVSYYSLKAK